MQSLSSPVGAAIYFLGVGALGVHLWHAFQSLFQSLGLNHPRYSPLIKKAGWGVAVLFSVLFWLFPTVCMLKPDRWSLDAQTSAEADAEPGATRDHGDQEGH